MFVVTWYEGNEKQRTMYKTLERAEQRAQELRKVSDLLKRTSFVPIIVKEEIAK